jgi:hypothetical protein
MIHVVCLQCYATRHNAMNVVQYCLDDISQTDLSQLNTHIQFIYAAYLQMYALVYGRDGNANTRYSNIITFSPFDRE